jgi:competence protein ComEA
VKLVGTLLSGLLARLTKTVRAAAAWRWGAPLARAAVAALGLVVLAAIGRSALAGNGSASKPAESAAEPAAPDRVPAVTRIEAPAPSALPVANVIAEAPVGPPALASPPDAGDPGARGRATPDDPVFLNQATVADLRRLPGVGAKRAQAILALRDRLGGFRLLEDLLKVKGIGRSSLKKLRPLVRLDLLASPPDAGAATLPPP